MSDRSRPIPDGRQLSFHAGQAHRQGFEAAMEKLYQEFLQHARATWRRRWWILPIAWLICLGGWAYVQQIPDTYQSSARVFVNTQSVLDPLLRGMTVRPDTEQRLRMMTRTLLSRDNLEEIARASDLDVLTGNDNLDAQVGMLRSRLSLDESRRGDNIFNISFRHGNPEVSYRVVQETVNLFMEQGLGSSRLDLTSSQQFIERQIESYREQLEEKEAEIEQFKRDNAAYLSSGGNFYSRLEQARERLEQAKLEQREAQRQVETFERRMAESRQSGEPVTSYQNPELNQRINRLESDLDSLRQRYTDQHPDVISTRRVLSELREQQETEAQEFSASGASVLGNAGQSQNPLQLALAEAESRAASLRERVQEYERRVARLEENVDRVPAVESEHTALTRDYDVLRDSYNRLLSTRERAIMSGEVETQTDSVDFRVLEPPRMPESPASPNRPALASMVLILGLGAGTGFAFLLAQLRGTVNNRAQLSELTGRPVLGQVSRVYTPLRRRRRLTELLVFAAATAGLLIAFALALGVYFSG
ncbi:polysaccharide chain length determinant protein (PEP-CTERM system associated) [Alkalispirillum mobile]|uniref:Polysaccharide chain length determinant protein (PEP-CTERM system associated) n=2 Tax=Alkalispirillum mobile TaxID=85925 RepID=A0A498C786_9GAMM|nr:polysaccharide chain length determinant protein (PEP-CTERM system associated) [Alkalispirillum mobile]